MRAQQQNYVRAQIVSCRFALTLNQTHQYRINVYTFSPSLQKWQLDIFYKMLNYTFKTGGRSSRVGGGQSERENEGRESDTALKCLQ